MCKGDSIEQASSCAINNSITNAVTESLTKPSISIQPSTRLSNAKTTTVEQTSVAADWMSTLTEGTTSTSLTTNDETGISK